MPMPRTTRLNIYSTVLLALVSLPPLPDLPAPTLPIPLGFGDESSNKQGMVSVVLYLTTTAIRQGTGRIVHFNARTSVRLKLLSHFLSPNLILTSLSLL
jgi:hypothetical protein